MAVFVVSDLVCTGGNN